jgi:hypothetical protein
MRTDEMLVKAAFFQILPVSGSLRFLGFGDDRRGVAPIGGLPSPPVRRGARENFPLSKKRSAIVRLGRGAHIGRRYAWW